ncbi:MAG: tyrosine-type recombinase/integrase, partial [Pirellulales bacterium]
RLPQHGHDLFGTVSLLHGESFPALRAGWILSYSLDQVSGRGSDRETADWLGGLNSKLHGKLAAVGLVPRRTDLTLGSFLDSYRAERTDLKPSTRANHKQAADNLVACFGTGKPIRSISSDALDGDRFRRFLIDLGLGENTIRKRCQIAKLFFKEAKRQKLVEENPFAELVGSVRSDRSKFHFVASDEADKILEACPGNEWRLIFALSRYGGLRCPSEHLALQWSDVDWANGRIVVHSPKTEHIPGHEYRFVPIFPELRPYLESAWDEAADGAEWVISGNRRPGVNWRTQLQRIMAKAGVKPWARLFHNLRATRQTELSNHFSQHVVCQWLGNSQSVANEHYLRVTDDHFDRAVRTPTSALQNPVQSAAATGRNDQQAAQPISEFAEEFNGVRSDATQIVLPVGLEPTTL